MYLTDRTCASLRVESLADPIGRTVPLLKPPRAHTVKLGRMMTTRSPPPLWSRCQSRSYRAYQVTQTPLFSERLRLPFDNQVCHACQICLRFHWILKVILEMSFSAHCTSIWMKVESNFYDHYWQNCQKMHLPPGSSMRDGTHIGGKLWSGAWKRGQGSNVGVFSLWLLVQPFIWACTD